MGPGYSRVSEATVDVADLRTPTAAEPTSRRPRRRRPAARGHPAARPGPGRGDRRAGRRGRPRAGRVHPGRGVRGPPLRGRPRGAGRPARPASTSRSANHVIRAFSHFSLLANLAEDIHHERRRRFHRREGSPPQKGSLAATFALLDERRPRRRRRGPRAGRRAGLPGRHRAPDRGAAQDDLPGAAAGRRADPAARPGRRRRGRRRRVVGAALALGAHPLADGAAAAVPAAAAGRDRRGAALLRAVAVRRRPGAQRRAAPGAAASAGRTPACCRGRCCCRARGSAATATATRSSPPTRCAGPPRRQAETALGHHLAELDGAARRAVDVRPAGHAHRRAVRAGRGVAGRLAVPRRRALPAGAARHLRPAGRHRAGGRSAAVPGPTPHAELPPYDSPDELRADLDVVDASLRSHGAGALADDRLLRLREAVEVFGFHLCGLDLRQNSAVHEEVVGELLAWAGVCDDYAALDEDGAGRAAGRRAARCAVRWSGPTPSSPRPPAASSTSCSPPPSRWRCSGRGRIPNYVISMCESVSDVLEVAVLLKEVGLLDPGAEGGPTCPVGISPLFETIDDLAGRRDDAGRDARPAAVPRAGGLPRRRAGGHARLLRQQQGRRLPRRQLGAVPGRARPGRGRARRGHPAAAVPRPRRHRRPRRRPELRGDPGAAAGRRRRRAADHRAGRGDRRQVRRPRPGPAQPRGAGRRHAGGEPARRRGARGRRRAGLRAARRPRRAAPSRPTGRWCTRRRASSTGSGRPRRSASSAS